MIDFVKKSKELREDFSVINKGVISFQGGEIDLMPKLMQDLGFVNNQSKILSEVERRKGLDSTDSDLIASKSAQSIRHILNKSAKSSVASLGLGQNVFLNLHRGGFCNRVRALCSLACFPNPNKYAYWQSDDSCDVEFSDLFDEQLVEKELGVKIIDVYGYAHFLEKEKDSFFSNDLSTAWSYWDSRGRIFSEWTDFSGKYENFVVKLFDCLLPNIRHEFNEINQNFYLRDRFGVHIRRGDFSPYYENKYNKSLASIEEIAIYLSRVCESKKIFISCDDSDYMNEFFRKSEFLLPGFDIKVNLNHQAGKLRETTVRSAIIDLICLSQSSSIIGTSGSSFSEMANSLWSARLGNKNSLSAVKGLEGVTSNF